MLDVDDFSKSFAGLFLCKGRQPDDKMCAVWYGRLKVYPGDKVLKAMATLADTPDDFPTVGKVIALLNPEITDAMVMDGWNTVLGGPNPKTPEMKLATEQIGGESVIGYTEYGIAQEQLGKRWRAAYKIILEKKHTGQIENAELPQVEDNKARLKLMSGGIGRKV